jgi:hypothetical protein
LAQLAKNIENAFGYARELGLVALEAELFIKSSNHDYRIYKCKFEAPVSTPESLIAIARKELPAMIRTHEKYRSTGVTLHKLELAELKAPQNDLFDLRGVEERRRGLHEVADRLYHKYDSRVLALASSMGARSRVGQLGRNLPLPYLGDVT